MKKVSTIVALLAASVCIVPATAGSRLPDGGTVSYASGNIAKAWYSEPTGRYDHGVLGDDVEGGALTVQARDGSISSLVLDETLVFEDITPRLADLNGDGNVEVITIVSSLTAGGSLAVFGLKNEKLQLAAKTNFRGKTHRWLNIAGVADYNGDGKTDVALVKTPHLGGALEVWSFFGNALRLVGSINGFSNHVIGTRDLDMSVSVDINDDDIPEILVPSADRTSLRLVGFVDGELREIASFALNGHVVGNFKMLDDAKIEVGLEKGLRQIVSLK